VIPLVSDRLPQGDHRADGVVLRRREPTPKSRECLLFLRNLGAVWVGAPGGKNRFGGGTEPITWGNFTLYQSPRRLYLKSVDIAEDFLSLRRSRRTILLAVKWCEKLADMLPPGHENDGALSLLWGCMKNMSLGASPALLDARFSWRWANLWGVAPSLEFCPSCGGPLDESGSVWRSPEGFLCGECSQAVSMSTVSREVFTILKFAGLSPREIFIKNSGGVDSLMRANEELAGQISAMVEWFYSFLRLI
jgi:DNA repair protein RecO (recombination protein O)